jgi:hypothetical protein
MELHPLVVVEWREDRALSQRSLIWIREHADVDDPDPLATAIAQLQMGRIDRFDVV